MSIDVLCTRLSQAGARTASMTNLLQFAQRKLARYLEGLLANERC